jgi:hypothetical protein
MTSAPAATADFVPRKTLMGAAIFTNSSSQTMDSESSGE